MTKRKKKTKSKEKKNKVYRKDRLKPVEIATENIAWFGFVSFTTSS